MATPLVSLTGKDVPFVWDSSCSTAFGELRAALIDAPILAFPTETGLYVLDTDASNFGLGGFLSQIQNDHIFSTKAMSMNVKPPTAAALVQHTKRAVYQGGHVWGQEHVRNPE